jgi:hypothetical protein
VHRLGILAASLAEGVLGSMALAYALLVAALVSPAAWVLIDNGLWGLPWAFFGLLGPNARDPWFTLVHLLFAGAYLGGGLWRLRRPPMTRYERYTGPAVVPREAGFRRRLAAQFMPMAALVRRELLRDLRRFRAMVCLAAFVGLAAILEATAWPMEVYATTAGTVAPRLFASLAQLMAAGAIVFVPGIAATAMARERERGTYDQLHMTLVSPMRIVDAFLLSGSGFFLLLLVGAMPVASMVLFLVGVDLPVVVLTFVYLLALAVFCAAWGLFAATRTRTTWKALLYTYVTILPAATLPYLLLALALEGVWQSSGSSFATGGMLMFGLAFLAIATVALRTAAARRLTRVRQDVRVPSIKLVDDEHVLLQRRNTFPYYIIDPLKRKPPIEDGRNPVFVREVRWGAGIPAAVAVRIFFGWFLFLLVLCLFFASPTGSYRREYVDDVRRYS